MSLNLKLVKGPEIRKAHILPQSVAELYACIDSIFGSTDFSITYIDAEGDHITVQTQQDLEDAYNSAISAERVFLKLYLEKSDRPVSVYIKESARQVESEDDEPEEFIVLEPKLEDEIPADSVPTFVVIEEPKEEVPVEVSPPEQAPAEALVIESPVEVVIEAEVKEIEAPAEPEVPHVEEEKRPVRKCGLKKAMWEAAKKFKCAFKPMCKKFKKEFKGCRPSFVPPQFQQEAAPVFSAPIFSADQVEYIRNIVREELGQTKPVHSRFTCDGCGVHPIVGVRYNCTVCRNFDFCESCEAKVEHAHPFIKHKTVSVPRCRPAPVQNEVVVDLDLGNVLPHVPEKLQQVVSKLQKKLSKKFAPKAPKVKGLKGKAVVHVTLEKFTEVQPETEYVKTWVLSNTGKVAWPAGTKMVQVRGRLSTQTVIEVPALAPQESAEVSVVIKTPARLGKAKGVWRFETPDGQKFGRAKCIVRIVSPDAMPDLVAETEETEVPAETEVSSLKAPSDQKKRPQGLKKKQFLRLKKQFPRLKEQR